MRTMFLLLFFLVFIIIGLSSTFTNYDLIDPSSLPEFTGDLTQVEHTLKYEDSQGEYIYILIDGKLYVYYI